MNLSKKYIGINQKIQFKVFDISIYEYLKNENINRELIKDLIREFISGENRIEKTTSYIIQIFKKQKVVIQWLKKNLSADGYISLPLIEREAISFSLIALTFPISYDFIAVLAGVFKVQENISKEAIVQKLSAFYGSNRSLYNALDSLIQMLMEQNKLNRFKMGIYEKGNIYELQYQITKEIIIYTDICLSNKKSILVSDIEQRKWFVFFPIKFEKNIQYNLFKYKESNVGEGYLYL